MRDACAFLPGLSDRGEAERISADKYRSHFQAMPVKERALNVGLSHSGITGGSLSLLL